MDDTMHMEKLRTMAKNCSKDEQRVILQEISVELILERLKRDLDRLKCLESGVKDLINNFTE